MPAHKWFPRIDNRRIELVQQGFGYKAIAEILNEEFDTDFTRNAVEIRCRNTNTTKSAIKAESYVEKFESEEEEDEESNCEQENSYKETTEILANGSYKSDKLIKMSAEQSKDINFLLEAHGFDNTEWELVNAKNNIWNVYSKIDGVQALFSSKVTVKPRENGFDFNKLIEVITTKVKPVTIKPKKSAGYSKLLEISLYDMHFGVSDLDYYYEHLCKIVEKIRSRSWEKILFTIGQDLLHNDNFKGQTANGTNIEKVDMIMAFNDALRFYNTLISEALENSKSIDCVYVKGNHDESFAYGLFRTLQATFPQARFEGTLKQRTAFVWKKVFIGLTHGDKGANRIVRNFISEYGKLIAHAAVKEIHSGHIHVEKTKDDFGIVHRTLSTANLTDDWHDDNGFVGANKRFQLFEYSPDSLDAIYYI